MTLSWLAARLQAFVDLNPEFEGPVDQLATWLAVRPYARQAPDGLVRRVPACEAPRWPLIREWPSIERAAVDSGV